MSDRTPLVYKWVALSLHVLQRGSISK